jgi:hypothetical protein
VLPAVYASDDEYAPFALSQTIMYQIDLLAFELDVDDLGFEGHKFIDYTRFSQNCEVTANNYSRVGE